MVVDFEYGDGEVYWFRLLDSRFRGNDDPSEITAHSVIPACFDTPLVGIPLLATHFMVGGYSATKRESRVKHETLGHVNEPEQNRKVMKHHHEITGNIF